MNCEASRWPRAHGRTCGCRMLDTGPPLSSRGCCVSCTSKVCGPRSVSFSSYIIYLISEPTRTTARLVPFRFLLAAWRCCWSSSPSRTLATPARRPRRPRGGRRPACGPCRSRGAYELSARATRLSLLALRLGSQQWSYHCHNTDSYPTPPYLYQDRKVTSE